MMGPPWWVSLLIKWLQFLVLILVWIILAGAMRRGLWRRTTDLSEAQLAEMRRLNALMERIAVALEMRTKAT
jgi:hypothetical protein